MAAFIARTLATTKRAFADFETPISASATCLALEVRFSISELEADSVRSRIAANGAAINPASASNRASSWLASSAMAAVAGDSGTDSASMIGGTAAW